MLCSIAEDLGFFGRGEITDTKAIVRVIINGLLPLLFTSTLEYSNGDEVTASLLYEKLEKHCKLCFRLDHEKEDCPLNPHTNQKLEGNPHMESQRKESLPSHRIAPSVERHSARNDPRQLSGFMRDARRANLPYNQKDLRSHLDNIYYAGDTRSTQKSTHASRSEQHSQQF